MAPCSSWKVLAGTGALGHTQCWSTTHLIPVGAPVIPPAALGLPTVKAWHTVRTRTMQQQQKGQHRKRSNFVLSIQDCMQEDHGCAYMLHVSKANAIVLGKAAMLKQACLLQNCMHAATNSTLAHAHNEVASFIANVCQCTIGTNTCMLQPKQCTCARTQPGGQSGCECVQVRRLAG